ncbi:MAG: SEL1-like repeat protein [Alphaproteobacteria bacterium]|nr:SEL1-like repeat protein [Alphaproteobacteria bacterium]
MSRMGPRLKHSLTWGTALVAVSLLTGVAMNSTAMGKTEGWGLFSRSEEQPESQIERRSDQALEAARRFAQHPLGEMTGLNDIFYERQDYGGARFYNAHSVYQFVLGQIFERDRSRSNPRAALLWYALAKNNPSVDEYTRDSAEEAIGRLMLPSGTAYHATNGLDAMAFQEVRQAFDCVYMVGNPHRKDRLEALIRLAGLYETGDVVKPVIDDKVNSREVRDRIERENLINANSWNQVILRINPNNDKNSVPDKLKELDEKLDAFGRMVAKLMTAERLRQIRVLDKIEATTDPAAREEILKNEAGLCGPVWQTILIADEGTAEGGPTSPGYSAAARASAAGYGGNPFRPSERDVAEALKRGSPYQQTRPDQETLEDKARAWLQVGKAHMAINEIDSAKVAFENAILADPTSPAALEAQEMLQGLTTTCDYRPPEANRPDGKSALFGGGYIVDPQLVGIDEIPTSMVQRALKALGFYQGDTDGVAGPATRRAYREFQRSLNVNQTDLLTREQKVQLMCKSAQLARFPEAQNVLGIMYLDGNLGLPQDIRLGIYWLERAADQQDPAALYNLGLTYAQDWTGMGPERNLELARQYLKEASQLGHPDASRKLNELK